CDALVRLFTPGDEPRLIAVVPRGARLVVHAPETATVLAGALTPENTACDGGVREPRVRRREPTPAAEQAARR
ncbi:MAG TPA: hypothetical protein VFT45_13090, partial [Longimicrobium sp.]|nr:hypothetical protein [Longimicrobium sp.]